MLEGTQNIEIRISQCEVLAAVAADLLLKQNCQQNRRSGKMAMMAMPGSWRTSVLPSLGGGPE